MSAKLDVKAMGLAFGILLSVEVIALGLFAAFADWGTPWVDFIGFLYIGYKPTLLGSLIGGVWALVDGAIAGVLVAFVYNKFAS
ncbi:MAG: bacteriophage holin [Candidatus Brocadiales bacterium]